MKSIFFLILIIVSIFATTVFAQQQDCAASDAKLLVQQATLCNSMQGATNTSCCSNPLNVPSMKTHHDWPMQSIYMTNLLRSFTDPTTCMNTTVARNMVNWLANNYSNPNSTCSFSWMWQNFQFGYYIMPRLPGERIESPYTLGEKSWAFALLQHYWKPNALQRVLAPLGLSLGAFAFYYNQALAKSFTVSNEVIANCFVNQSYNPARNGTCSGDVLMFKLGFDYENLRCGQKINNPYWLP
jgi:hypothetical protein